MSLLSAATDQHEQNESWFSKLNVALAIRKDQNQGEFPKH